jgi:hypothetical protein
MARDTDHLAGNLDTENTGGLLTGFLAEEDEFDRRAMWRLGSWGVASVGAVIIALYASQSSIGLRREQFAAADLTRQSQQIQSVAKESASETRRLASAIDTLNGDRDRLYSRVTVLEQGLDSVTGAIARQSSGATSPQAAATTAASEPQLPSQNPAPVVSPVAATAAKTGDKPATDAVVPEQAPATVASVAQPTANAPAATPSTPLMAAKSMMAPPDPAAGKLIEPAGSPNTVASAPMPDVEASVAPADEADLEQADAPKSAVQRTEFGVDVGGANSLPGLRALWRGLLKSKSNSALAALRPIIVVRESSTGLGMQLRLVAGPLIDAAAAAKICAAMTESKRACETTVFDGQRLAMKADEAPAVAKPAMRKRSTPKGATADEPAKKPESSTLSSLFGRVRGGQ